jgi:hypothetical protein
MSSANLYLYWPSAECKFKRIIPAEYRCINKLFYSMKVEGVLEIFTSYIK